MGSWWVERSQKYLSWWVPELNKEDFREDIKKTLMRSTPYHPKTII